MGCDTHDEVNIQSYATLSLLSPWGNVTEPLSLMGASTHVGTCVSTNMRLGRAAGSFRALRAAFCGPPRGSQGHPRGSSGGLGGSPGVSGCSKESRILESDFFFFGRFAYPQDSLWTPFGAASASKFTCVVIRVHSSLLGINRPFHL